MTPEQNYAYIEPSLIDSSSEIDLDIDVAYSFVVYNGKLALARKDCQSHKQIALETELYYPESQDSNRPFVDDGGIIIDFGSKLVIKDYFTRSCCLKKTFEASPVWNEKIAMDIRRETGQLIANISNRNVTIELSNDIDELISPNNI